MKSSFLLLIAIFLNSCLTYAPPDQILYDNGLVDFAMDIAQNPEKLYNLKKFYPQFYNEEYVFITMKDTICGLSKRYQYSLKDRINRIKAEFTDIDEKINPLFLGVGQGTIEEMNWRWGTKYDFHNKELYGITLHKDDSNVCLEFIFVRSDSTKFNIFFIKKDKIRVKM